MIQQGQVNSALFLQAWVSSARPRRSGHRVRSLSANRLGGGFTLVELLLVIGVISVLAALLIPVLASSRASASGSVSLSNVRQIGVALSSYASENKDLPPVIYKPVEVYNPPGPVERVTVNGIQRSGLWFYTTLDYPVSFSPLLPAAVLLAPGSTRFNEVDPQAPEAVRATDYLLTACLYAEPSYWDRYTQRGASQWGAQRLSRTAFPSSKGLVRQHTVYGLPNRPYRMQTADIAGVLSSVLWADLSAGNLDQSKLHPGVPNFFYHSDGGGGSLADDGTAIDHTQDGMLGRDRSSP